MWVQARGNASGNADDSACNCALPPSMHNPAAARSVSGNDVDRGHVDSGACVDVVIDHDRAKAPHVQSTRYGHGSSPGSRPARANTGEQCGVESLILSRATTGWEHVIVCRDTTIKKRKEKRPKRRREKHVPKAD